MLKEIEFIRQRDPKQGHQTRDGKYRVVQEGKFYTIYKSGVPAKRISVGRNGKTSALLDAKAWIAEWEGFGDAFWGYPEPRGTVHLTNGR
jgi:hypothetical protein